MPEGRESIAHVISAQTAFEVAQRAIGWIAFKVIGLWADYTDAEALRAPSSTPGRRGYVDVIGPHSMSTRGQKDNQTSLYPPQLRSEWQESKKKLSPAQLLEGLAIEGPHSISGTDRTMVVNLGGLVLQLAYILHTSPQLFTRSQWNTILRVHKKDRAFKVGLAIEFETHVFAFLTKDLLFQPTWWSSMDDIVRPPSIVHDYLEFLATIAAWILEEGFLDRQIDKPGTQLASEVFRNSKVWYGAGVYTTSEAFRLAGISPFLTATEVFKNPSRLARLILALYTFMDVAYDSKFRSLITTAMSGTVLAPTASQRENYAQFLDVYAQRSSLCGLWESELIDHYIETLNSLGSQPRIWSRSDEQLKLFDVFEPDRIQAGLDITEGNLGHLVFGDTQWELLGYTVPEELDPITQLFVDTEIIQSTTSPPPLTYLNHEVYQVLFTNPPKGTLRNTKKTYFYHCSRQIWSLVPNYPPNCSNTRRTVIDDGHKVISSLPSTAQDSYLAVNDGKEVEHKINDAYEEKLFLSIIRKGTTDVAIGPLEYCGNASWHSGPGGRRLYVMS
ncbi:hypothetical protein PQX77_010067 [Marasmius sp. AFHP31]|nr:hypothetical protein PQX77_010067 [Marasmius sp. AFHP31]